MYANQMSLYKSSKHLVQNLFKDTHPSKDILFPFYSRGGNYLIHTLGCCIYKTFS